MQGSSNQIPRPVEDVDPTAHDDPPGLYAVGLSWRKVMIDSADNGCCRKYFVGETNDVYW